MREWVLEFWNTKAGFERTMRSLLFVVGLLVQHGVIPTGVESGGSVIGPLLQAAALLVKAGDKNLPTT